MSSKEAVDSPPTASSTGAEPPAESPDRARAARGWRVAAGTLLLGLFLLNGLLVDVAVGPLAPPGLSQSTLFALRQILAGNEGADSWAPMRSALKAAGAPGMGGIYQQVFFAHRLKFQYPPSSLLPVEALERLRHPAVRERRRDRLLNDVTRIAYLLTIAATVALLDLRLRAEAKRSGRALGRGQRLLAALGGVGITALFYPLVKGLELGQIQPWIDALFAVALLFWLSRAEGAAGLALGFTFWLKPQFGLLLLWGILRGRWRFVLAFGATALAGAIWAIARFGWAEHVDYLRVLSVLAHHGESYFPNNSLNGLLHRLAGIGNPEVPNTVPGDGYIPPYVPWIYVVTLISSTAILALGLWRARGSGAVASAADLGAMTLAATMASPIAWTHHYGILPPLLALLLASAWEDSRRVPAGWLLASYLLAANCFAFTLYLAATPLNFLETHLYAGAWIALVLLVRLRNETVASPDIQAEPRPAENAPAPRRQRLSRGPVSPRREPSSVT